MPAPGQLPDDAGRLLARDLAGFAGAPVAARQPVARRHLRHAGQCHAEQVGVGVGEVGVAGDDLGQRLATGEGDALDSLGDGRLIGEVGLEDQPERRALPRDELEVCGDTGDDALLVVVGAGQRIPDGLLEEPAVVVDGARSRSSLPGKCW